MHPPLSRKRGLVDAVRNVPAPPAQLLLGHREGVARRQCGASDSQGRREVTVQAPAGSSISRAQEFDVGKQTVRVDGGSGWVSAAFHSRG
jgi:hypothetical protein